MEDMWEFWAAMFAEPVQKAVLSNPQGPEPPCRKITAVRKKDGAYHVEKRTATQAFHETVPAGELSAYCQRMLAEGFRQLNIFGEQNEYSLRFTRKGKPLFHRSKRSAPLEEAPEHNRKKKYLLEENTRIAPLVDMGIFTPEGKVVPSMYDKYRQINRFIEIVDDAVGKLGQERLTIIDFGCGKSYLTFLIYHYLTEVKKLDVHITGLDLKADVIAKCSEAAKKYGYRQLEFSVGDIRGYRTEQPVDMVVTLHACDTATDYALYHAVCWKARAILSVPCCQHELMHQMDSEELPILQRYGIVKERSAALMTDAIRANLLESCGYKTQLLEFIDLEHTPKNILIRAVRTAIPQKQRQLALREVRQLTDCFHLEPTLARLLAEGGWLPPIAGE